MQNTGMNPAQRIRRNTSQAPLLLSGRQSIGEIAVGCGFCDRALSVEQFPQLDLRFIQDSSPLRGEASAGPIDLEIQHGHSRLERGGFAPVAVECRAAQR
jgi:hypothetical protein